MSENEFPTLEPMVGILPVARKRHRIRKIIGIVLAVFVVLIVAVTLIANAATKAPLAASNQFLNSIQAGDAPAAYEFFSTEAKKTVTSSQFDSVVQKISPILNAEEKLINKKVNGQTGSAATSEITYEISGTDARTYSLVVNLVKEGDLWKVLNFDSKVK